MARRMLDIESSAAITIASRLTSGDQLAGKPKSFNMTDVLSDTVLCCVVIFPHTTFYHQVMYIRFLD